MSKHTVGGECTCRSVIFPWTSSCSSEKLNFEVALCLVSETDWMRTVGRDASWVINGHIMEDWDFLVVGQCRAFYLILCLMFMSRKINDGICLNIAAQKLFLYKTKLNEFPWWRRSTDRSQILCVSQSLSDCHVSIQMSPLYHLGKKISSNLSRSIRCRSPLQQQTGHLHLAVLCGHVQWTESFLLTTEKNK